MSGLKKHGDSMATCFSDPRWGRNLETSGEVRKECISCANVTPFFLHRILFSLASMPLRGLSDSRLLLMLPTRSKHQLVVNTSLEMSSKRGTGQRTLSAIAFR